MQRIHTIWTAGELIRASLRNFRADLIWKRNAGLTTPKARILHSIPIFHEDVSNYEKVFVNITFIVFFDPLSRVKYHHVRFLI